MEGLGTGRVHKEALSSCLARPEAEEWWHPAGRLQAGVPRWPGGWLLQAPSKSWGSVPHPSYVCAPATHLGVLGWHAVRVGWGGGAAEPCLGLGIRPVIGEGVFGRGASGEEARQGAAEEARKQPSLPEAALSGLLG